MNRFDFMAKFKKNIKMKIYFKINKNIRDIIMSLCHFYIKEINHMYF